MNGGIKRWLDGWARRVAENPRRVLVGGLAIAVLLGALTIFLHLDQDISGLFPRDDPEVSALEALRSTLAGTNFALILLTVPKADPPLLREGADRLAACLLEEKAVDRVRWRITKEERAFFAETFLSRAFLFLPPDALETALEKMSPEGMEREIAECERLLLSPLPKAEERVIQDPLNLFEDVFLPLLSRRSVGAKLDFETGHTLSADGRAALIQVWGRKSPRDLTFARQFMDALQRAVGHFQEDARFPPERMQVRITGGYPVALENERSVKRNLIICFIGAFVGVLILFMAVFRSLSVNVTVGLPLAVGVLCAFGAAAPLLGFRMTAIASAFAAIMVGLGIDFPIHLFHRFREESDAGKSTNEAIRTALSRTGPGVISAGLTTAAAFGLLAFAHFRGMIEVGLFVGLGMVVILAVMLTLLPALIVLIEKRPPQPHRTGIPLGLTPLQRAHERAGGLIFLAAILLVVLSAVDLAGWGIAPFDADVRRLRSPSPEVEKTNAAIGAHFGLSLNPLLVVVRAPTREEALDRAADAEARIEPLFQRGRIAAALGPGSYFAGPLRTRRTRERLKGFDPAGMIRRLEETLKRHDLYEDPEVYQAMFRRLKTALETAAAGDRQTPPTGPRDILFDPFLATDGKATLAVMTLYLPLEAGTREHLHVGAEALRLVGGHLGEGGVVTSVDLLVHRLKDQVIKELSPISLLVALAVLVIASVHFRHPLWTLFALMPAAFGFLITLSAMKLLNLPLNFMNIVVFPMILGIGVDDGIHFMHRWREGEDWRKALTGAGMPIVMTSLTSMVGFGSLVLADNAGLRSVGWIAILGLGACMGCTLMIMPPLCRLMERKRIAGGESRENTPSRGEPNLGDPGKDGHSPGDPL
ncbi:MAG: efflux RND transporter permease subunit [Planctomycetota bacterium]|jgi:predicted RND superfamily exporter protein